MATDSDYFGGEPPQGFARERIDHVQLPDGRIRMIRRYYVESVPPGGMLVERERQEILCEWQGDQWVIPGENGEVIDGYVLCRRCSGTIRSKQFWRKIFGVFLKEEKIPKLPDPSRRLLR